jgi:hypothetical protein
MTWRNEFGVNIVKLGSAEQVVNGRRTFAPDVNVLLTGALERQNDSRFAAH